MTDLPTRVTINEEGPREGFQIEPGPIDTARKIELIDALSETGLGTIQVASFVNPRRVPGWADADAVVICGRRSGRNLPDQRRRDGMGFVPEERLGRGAVARMSLTENALLTAHHRGMLRHGMIQFDRIVEFARRCIAEFNVKCGGEEHAANSLSGGNLQKFIMGREILLAPKMLVVAQPTWGVDVGAAAFIRQQLIDLRDSGTAILVISEELDELFEISDRIAVIANGRLSPVKNARAFLDIQAEFGSFDPTNVNPRRLRSLLIASDSVVCAGTWDIFFQRFCRGAPSTNRHT